jgi:hypothetical protein
MRAKGLTDYVAWPLYHTLGKRHIVTFATDQSGGFDDAHIAGLLKLLPVWRWSAKSVSRTGGANAARNLCRVPASSFWPAPPGAEMGRRYAPPS